MQLVQNVLKSFYDTFFNMNAAPKGEELVDVRDLPMATRFTCTDNPFNGWGYFIMDAANKEHRERDAFKITEEGYTYYEARLYAAIQQEFQKRHRLVVTLETIERFEREAAKHPDYYSRLAIACMEYEKSHVQITN
jgi:hypothetical protein